MKKLIIPFILMLNFIYFAGANENKQELKTVEYVDLNRIMGKWYEIARIPNFLERNLVVVTATYTLLPNGDIELLNMGRKLTLDGEIRIKKGKAWILDKKTNAKLRASFIWPFSCIYCVIEIGKNYEYAVIGNPERTSLWILSRKPKMNEKLYNNILKRLEIQGYNLLKLEEISQK